jgi:hypothetical protein
MSLRPWLSSLAISCFCLVAVSAPCFASVERVNSSDIDVTTNTTTNISVGYDSGATGTNRYSVFVIQLNSSSDAVTSVHYGNATATLLYKRQSQYAQSNNYNYFYGLSEPATGTNTLLVSGNAVLPANVLAATYSGVDSNQPGLTQGAGIGFASSTWSSVFVTDSPGELAIIASGDNNGNMTAGTNAGKLSTARSNGTGLQVWEAGPYSTADEHYFNLVGSNGNAMDVQFITLLPEGAASEDSGIVRVSVDDIDFSSNTGTSFMGAYDSGATSSGRYSIFVVQLASSGDNVAAVTYGNVSATLLMKRPAINVSGNKYDYIFGLDQPLTGDNELIVHGSSTVFGFVTAVTYSGVDSSKTNVFYGSGSNDLVYTWKSAFESTESGEVAIISSRDITGELTAGENTEKLSISRSSNEASQVWEGGEYLNAGINSFELLAVNSSKLDVVYITLGAEIASSTLSKIARGNVSDFDDSATTTSVISHMYDSGSSADDRYAVFIVQLNDDVDAIESVTYGTVTATLLFKRQSAYAQSNNYNYIFGVANPPSGSNALTVSGSQSIPAYILAATYIGVGDDAVYGVGGFGIGSNQISWRSVFDVDRAGVIAVVGSADNNGQMLSGGDDTDKLSTARTANGGLQVWESGPFEMGKKNEFRLSGSNGNATDVSYVLFKPSE